MSEEDILLGIALVVALAAACQILAGKLRVPALILLLPAGFAAGALTDVIHPDQLIGESFSALVSLSVAVILYDAGLGLDLRNLTGHTRAVVGRLLLFGVAFTFLAVCAVAPALFSRSAGLDVQMWAGLGEERERIKDAGITLARGDLLATATNPRARLEGVNAVFLLTDDDDFNALASVLVEDNVEGPVYRVGPPHESHGVVAPYTGGAVLFGGAPVRHVLAARYEQGARFRVQPASDPLPPGHETLFVISADGRLVPVDGTQTLTPQEGDRVVLLGPVPTQGT
ncbi:cation:proton antiporter [Streptomyces sp. NPDC006544]|uniref:cation:proton antiporter n=1 Tax=Streptomyces sp. NPDC006544 TaxID=3154583 RepID=UPI0033A0190A